MLKIQVLGKGLIPRGYGIAPKKNPFPADLILIETILQTPGLKVRMQHPGDGHFIDVTTSNIKKLWNQYSDKYVKDPKAGMSTKVEVKKPESKPLAGPTIPSPTLPTIETPVEEVKVEEKVEEKIEVVKEEVKEEAKKEEKVEEKTDTFKPMTNDNYNNQKKNKHGNNNNNNNFKPIQNPNNKD